MNTLEAIRARRSIRRFKPAALERPVIERILEATIQAPSGKNRQPWRFVVLTGKGKDRLVEILRAGIETIRAAGGDPGSSPATARVMEQTPVTVVVFSAPTGAEGKPWQEQFLRVNVQSVGGAIQTMCLAATELGVGSLWIADVYYAERQIVDWIGRPGETLIGAVSLGHPDESPPARSRKPLAQVVEWRDKA